MEELEQWPRGELGDAPAALGSDLVANAEGPAVETLHELNAGIDDERADEPAREVRTEALGVGVHEGDHVAAQDRERAPHRVALTEHPPEGRHEAGLGVHLGAEATRYGAGPVPGRLDDHALTDDAAPATPGSPTPCRPGRPSGSTTEPMVAASSRAGTQTEIVHSRRAESSSG